jgi:hypothetical protein
VWPSLEIEGNKVVCSGLPLCNSSSASSPSVGFENDPHSSGASRLELSDHDGTR